MFVSHRLSQLHALIYFEIKQYKLIRSIKYIPRTSNTHEIILRDEYIFFKNSICIFSMHFEPFTFVWILNKSECEANKAHYRNATK